MPVPMPERESECAVQTVALYWQGGQPHCINQLENRGVGANAEG